MKKISSIILMTVPVTIFFTCCDREAADIEYPSYTQKMIITGYISPDKSSNLIDISSNLRIYGGELYKVNNLGNVSAIVSNGEIEKALDTAKTGFAFKSPGNPVEEGRTYRLKISSNIGSVDASCTVPFRRKFNLKLDTIQAPGYMHGYYDVKVRFTDYRGEDNYYLLFCEQVMYRSGKVFYSVFQFSGKNYISDKGNDGSEFRMNVAGVIGASNMTDSSFVKVILLNTDENYYKFMKSLDNYNSGEDPFTEPSPVYSNVNGGLGIFATYTTDSLIFKLK